MTNYAYLLDDPVWPPMLHEIVNHNWTENPDLESYALRPINNPSRIIWAAARDVWVIA